MRALSQVGVRPFKELLAACEDRELAAEALRCVHANDFVGLDARVAESAEPEAVKAPLASCRACMVAPRCSTVSMRCWRRPVSLRR